METRRLYEIARDFEEIENLILNDEAEKFTEALNTTLEGLNYEFDEKIKNLVRLIKNVEIQSGTLTGYKEALEKEIKAVNDKIKARENKIKELKNYILSGLEIAGKTKVKTPEFTAYKGTTKILNILDSDKALNSDFTVTKKEINKRELLNYLAKNNNNLDFAEVKEKNYLIIR